MSNHKSSSDNYQVPEGYKQTEVGVIPEDWIDCSIKYLIEEEIIEKPLDGNHGNIHPKSKDFVPFGIPFIMSNNIHDGLVDTRNCHFIRKQQADQLQKGFSFKGDVLLTHKGTVGNVAIVTDIETYYIMLTPQVTYYRVRNHNRLKNTFIKFYFESTQFQEKIEQLSGGGTRAYIGITNQRKLPFVLPPFPEQCAIARALSDADTLIAALDKQLAKKRHIKTATMQQLLTGKKRLPGFGEGKGYKKTDFGVIPEDWEVKTVGEAFEIRNNLRLPISKKSRNYMQGKYPYYGPTHVQDYINEYRVEGEHALIGEDGDHFLKWRDISMTLLVDGKFNVNNHAHIIKGVENLTSWFYYFFAHRDLTPYLKRQGAGRYKLNKNTLINIPCAIPLIPEQRAIAQILTDIDTKIAALEKRRAKTQAIKQGMMQELLTGRTRLI